MQSYISEQTPKTPLINLNADTGVFKVKGKSIPENSKTFYTPMFEWLDKYAEKPAPNTVLDIQLDYFNTSSAKCVVDLFKKLEIVEKSGKSKVVINWHHHEDDGDMQEAGQDFQSIIKTEFNLISFNN